MTLGPIAQNVTTSVNWPEVGVIGVLVLGIVWTGFKRKWVFGWIFDQTMAGLQEQLRLKSIEANEWKRLALIQGGIIEQTVERTSAIVRKVVVDADPRINGGDADE
jgi:hypothetical protein